jgi:hypothetical protein
MSKLFWIPALILLAVSCRMKVEPGIKAGIDECEHCTMIIQDIDQGAVAADVDEQLHTFCNPICLIYEFNKLKKAGNQPSWQNYLFDHGDETAVPAPDAFIVHGDFQTAMGHGLLAFHTRESAVQFAGEVSGEMIAWDDLRINHENPDVSVQLSSEIVQEPDVFEALRGEIIQVSYDNNTGLQEVITLSGYDFALTVEPGSSGRAAFIADKPGQGFAFQGSDGRILGMLFVGGDHTSEEAIYR